MSFFEYLFYKLSEGIFGLFGAGLFFLSWIYQSYISHKNNRSSVDLWFWIMRTIGMFLLMIHTIITKDIILTTMNGVGALIYLYNVSFYLKEAKND